MNEESLFAAAIALPTDAEREAFLTKVCGPDVARRGRLQQLLSAHDRSVGLLESKQPAGRRAVDGSGANEVTFLFGLVSPSIVAAFGDAFGKIPPILLRDVDSDIEPDPITRPSATEVPPRVDPSSRLQILGEIARGGMGAVLKGRDSDLGRDLAVKILLESHRDKPDMIRRFIEEAQIAGQLQHPGIVPIYELGAFSDRRPYFAMKLVKGQTLAEILANRKSPSDGLMRLLSIFESICQTMAYTHARGVIHRDLKPSNVMVGSFGEVQVMDWGLAKVLPRGGVVADASAGQTKDLGTVIATARSVTESDQSQAGSILGTPSYMAPEQARGELDEVDERADVFALGSIFCEILTNQPAFSGRTSGEILRKAARGELTDALARLDDKTFGNDPELIALAKSCLSPERDDRPRQAGEIAERLTLYHSQVQQRLKHAELERARAEARAIEEHKRSRLRLALAAAVIGLFVLGGGGWAYLSQAKANRIAATDKVVSEAIEKATFLRGQAKAAPVGDLSKWTEALAAAKQAEGGLQAGEPSEPLRKRVAELIQTLKREEGEAIKLAFENERDRKLFAAIDAIRIQFVRADEVWFYGRPKESKIAAEQADEAYAAALREFGLDVDQIEPAEAGKLLRQRSRPQEIAFAIDAWALIRKDLARNGEDRKLDPLKNRLYHRLAELASVIDDDPWRCAIRTSSGMIDMRAGHEGGEVTESNAAYSSVLQLATNEKELTKQPARALYVLALMLERSNPPLGSNARLERNPLNAAKAILERA